MKLLFTSLGRSVFGKTVPSVLVSGGTQDLGHTFSQYGPERLANNRYVQILRGICTLCVCYLYSTQLDNKLKYTLTIVSGT